MKNATEKANMSLEDAANALHKASIVQGRINVVAKGEHILKVMESITGEKTKQPPAHAVVIFTIRESKDGDHEVLSGCVLASKTNLLDILTALKERMDA